MPRNPGREKAALPGPIAERFGVPPRPVIRTGIDQGRWLLSPYTVARIARAVCPPITDRQMDPIAQGFRTLNGDRHGAGFR